MISTLNIEENKRLFQVIMLFVSVKKIKNCDPNVIIYLVSRLKCVTVYMGSFRFFSIFIQHRIIIYSCLYKELYFYQIQFSERKYVLGMIAINLLGRIRKLFHKMYVVSTRSSPSCTIL